MYYCRKCNSMISAEQEQKLKCEECGSDLIETAITEKQWKKMPKMAKYRTLSDYKYYPDEIELAKDISKQEDDLIPTPIRYFLLICLIIIMITRLFPDLFVRDHSAEEISSGTISWNGTIYKQSEGKYVRGGGHLLATSTDRKWDLYSLKGDNNLHFVDRQGFLDDNGLFTSIDIPTEGKLSAINWRDKLITAPDFLRAISDILESDGIIYKYKVPYGSFGKADVQGMIYMCYDDCPVSIDFRGYFGRVNGQWMRSIKITDDPITTSHPSRTRTITCKTIPNEYAEILEKYSH